MSGYIKLHRSVWETADFDGDEFSRREAWIWLISQAAWKPTTQRDGSRVITVERGQYLASVRQLCDAWGWSKSRVHRFLTALKNRDMIGTVSGTGRTLITICNYEDYQDGTETAGTPGERKAGQQRDTKEEGKKEEDISPPLVPPTKSEKRATRLPDDWSLPDEWRRWALDNSRLTAMEIDDAADRFRDYWIANGGANARKRDWLATWRNWVRRERPRNRPPERHRDPVLAALEAFETEGDAGGLDGGGTGPARVPETDMGSGRGRGEASGGAVIDLFPVRGGATGQGASWPDPNVQRADAAGGDHGDGLRYEAVGLSASRGCGGGQRLDGDAGVFPRFVGDPQE